MTGECRTGTDRLAQAVQALDFDLQNLIVVNVQGDEPFINPRHVELLIEAMQSDASLQMATLATPLPQHLTDDPNVVKVVCAQNGNALYFSRLPIPFARDNETVPRLRHLGVYAYRADWLLRMANLPSTPLEESEKLEQLRALENGVAIRVITVEDVVDIAIDTPEDLQRAEEFLATDEHR
jgi:3-deoxy-manno-octulosonate cytidylyltransferase (CMP-KDO synthetase)